MEMFFIMFGILVRKNIKKIIWIFFKYVFRRKKVFWRMLFIVFRLLRR